MEKETFFELLDKYLSGKTNLEENKLLINYYESFQTASAWDESLGEIDEIKSKMLERLQNTLAFEELKVIPVKQFYSTAFFRFSLAASVALIISITFLFNGNDIAKQSKPMVVRPIEIGSNKAILTLGNGSLIKLGKGNTYSAGNVNSNGEKLVYNSNNNTSETTSNYLTIPRGGQFFLQLSDSTKVWLNSESQLKYPVTFVDGKTRQVELIYGEAYFEVSPSIKHKGARFKVKTQMQNVEVVGTEFNIKAYKNETNIYTTLVEGSVEISNTKMKQILAPNQQSNLNLKSNSIKITTVDVYSEISWKKGVFVFKGLSLKEISKVLSRWYDVDIEFADTALENVKFNGTLNKNQNIENILTTIKTTNYIKAYEIKNNKIILK
jgi:transmembrane sensor